MIRTKFLNTAIALLSVVCVANSSHADILYSTNFNAPTYSDGPIIGQDGWILTNSTVNPINVANTASNGNVSLITSGQDVRRPFTATPAASLVSIFLGADITVSAAQTNGDYFLHLGDNSTSNFYSRIYARLGGDANSFQMALGTSSGATGLIWGADLNLNQVYNINARYDVFDGPLNDQGFLFVDGNPYIAALSTGTDATTFSSVSLRQGSASNAPTVTVDNIVVNSVAIPEPSTIALLGLLCMGAVMNRRRSA